MNKTIHVRETALGKGLRTLVSRLEERLAPTQPLRVCLAGGLAVHLYVPKRVSSDVDAEFSARVLIPNDLVVDVQLEDGTSFALHFDTNYNASFALMHDDYELDALPTDVQFGQVRLFVLAPVDLALSKVSRFSDVDREDISALAAEGLFTPAQFEQRAHEAVSYYGGDRAILANIDEAAKMVRAAYPAEDGRRSGEGSKG